MARKQTGGLRAQVSRALAELRGGRGRRKKGRAYGAAEEIRRRFLRGGTTTGRRTTTRRRARTKT